MYNETGIRKGNTETEFLVVVFTIHTGSIHYFQKCYGKYNIQRLLSPAILFIIIYILEWPLEIFKNIVERF